MERDCLRSDCPINLALEMLGDKWSLLVIRDLMLAGKHSYGEFLKSDEGIATNILSNRLSTLEADGIISKTRDTENRTKYIYALTPRGLDLIPLVVDIMVWTDSIAPVPAQYRHIVERAKHDRQQLMHDLRSHLEAGKHEAFESTLATHAA